MYHILMKKQIIRLSNDMSSMKMGKRLAENLKNEFFSSLC